jgi:putative thioredoxin
MADVGEANFQQQVIERSKELPVVVDFWAEWCGPCRTLGPAIEKAVADRDGKVELAKVDIEANPGLAQQFGIQSIPAVKAFRDGEVVEEFLGAVPPSAIEKFLDKVGPSRADDAVAEARELIRNGDDDGAREILKPLAVGNFLADGLLARLDLAAEGNDELAGAFEAWDSGNPEDALEQLQKALAADPERQDQLRRVMVAIFTELGADHPLAREHRRRLAAALN